MPWTIDIAEPSSTAATDFKLQENRSGLAELSEFYRQLGFESGYSQAARDQLGLSVATAEQILREQSALLNGPKEARRLLYAFIARIDRRLSLFANSVPSDSSDNYVEGGLGI